MVLKHNKDGFTAPYLLMFRRYLLAKIFTGKKGESKMVVMIIIKIITIILVIISRYPFNARILYFTTKIGKLRLKSKEPMV